MHCTVPPQATQCAIRSFVPCSPIMVSSAIYSGILSLSPPHSSSNLPSLSSPCNRDFAPFNLTPHPQKRIYTGNASKVVVPHQNVGIICMYVDFIFPVGCTFCRLISFYNSVYFEEAEYCLVSLCRHPCVLCHILVSPFLKERMSLNKH